jgi:small subunit ribosomal protein S1
MGYRPEDLELDEGYWKSLLSEAEHDALTGRRAAGHDQTSGRGSGQHPSKEHAANALVDGAAPDAEHNERHERHDARDPMARHRPITQNQGEPSDEEVRQLWQTLDEALRGRVWLDVEVTGVNRGGLIVHFRALRGFVPSSHLSAVSPDMDEPTRRGVLANHLGHKMKLRVIELEPTLDRIVFSERAAPEESDEPMELPPILSEVQAGETRHGKVTNLTAFGAFVDLGGYEGLVHVSELSWSRVGHPRDLLSIGQEVDVFVINADPTQGRIALSLKRAKHDPWHGIEQRYQVGQIVHGVITNVVQFGAFAKVEDDLEGLIHVSELAEGSFLHPRNIVREGDQVTARVIGVDGGARRLALSLRGVGKTEFLFI